MRKIVIVALALFLPLSLSAQQKKKKVVKKPVVVQVEEPQEDPRITEMREATQQIVFVDSIVVPRADVLGAIRINPESGQLTTFDRFFHSQGHDDSYVYVNEMGNKCYFSDDDDKGRFQLFTRDLLGEEWSAPAALSGISEGISEANYPYMMADGTTFYFAARGSESIGGYDIFVTRYDAENSRFLRPENIGMPFNSEANDYLYVVDEMANIGYFVTDRRQPEGKVCVYTFIPPTTRRTYDTDRYSDAQLRQLAAIHRIADTWGNGNARKQALQRLTVLRSSRVDNTARGGQPSDISFVVNDRLTYTSISQFRHADSPMLFKELLQSRKTLAEMKQNLAKSRVYYTKASAEDRLVLRKEILFSEQQTEQLAEEIRQLEKRIRNLEIKAL